MFVCMCVCVFVCAAVVLHYDHEILNVHTESHPEDEGLLAEPPPQDQLSVPG